MIDWIAPALGSPATFSVVSLLDKAVLSRFGLSSSGLSLFVGGNQLVLATVVLLIVPLESPGRNAILGGLGAGAFQGLGLALMFFMLKREDVSRVIPIFQTSPIFVIMLALVFLDESLSLLQWLGVSCGSGSGAGGDEAVRGIRGVAAKSCVRGVVPGGRGGGRVTAAREGDDG